MKNLLLFLLCHLSLNSFAQINEASSNYSRDTYMSNHNITLQTGYMPRRNYSFGVGYEYMLNRRTEGRWLFSTEFNFMYVDLSSSGFWFPDDKIYGGSLRLGTMFKPVLSSGHMIEFQAGGAAGVSGNYGVRMPSLSMGYRWQSDTSPFIVRMGLGVPDLIYFKIGVALI